jgi:hypothetical protein
MSDQTPIITHEPVNIVLTIENGKVIHAPGSERRGYSIAGDFFMDG